MFLFDTELFANPFILCYENEPADKPDDDETPPPAGGKPGEAKTYTQAQIDEMITKRTEKARKAQKAALDQLEAFQQTARLTSEEKENLEVEIERLRKQTLTAEEITKREAKKAKEAYEARVTTAEKAAQTWEKRFKDMTIRQAVHTAAAEHGVLPTSIPFVEAFLGSKIKLEEVKNETGEVTDFAAVVNFGDIGADGKPIEVQLPVKDTLKRMKELPDLYGNLFLAPSGGGAGAHSGRPNSVGGKAGFRSGMSQEEYMKLRRENPAAVGLA